MIVPIKYLIRCPDTIIIIVIKYNYRIICTYSKVSVMIINPVPERSNLSRFIESVASENLIYSLTSMLFRKARSSRFSSRSIYMYIIERWISRVVYSTVNVRNPRMSIDDSINARHADGKFLTREEAGGDRECIAKSNQHHDTARRPIEILIELCALCYRRCAADGTNRLAVCRQRDHRLYHLPIQKEVSELPLRDFALMWFITLD